MSSFTGTPAGVGVALETAAVHESRRCRAGRRSAASAWLENPVIDEAKLAGWCVAADALR